ncbi:MAG: hypothetical protein BRC29_00830 [Nanohaloarchaea archaeon SW_7_43_1]|nr:MAG: hypothetical protein BRC29_00830 [Nanohaloarchaea archaeon SW_7_43_1]
MNTKNVSSREAEIIDEIEGREMLFFSPTDISRFLGIEKRNAYNLLSRMQKKELVERIESGKYVLTKKYNSRDIYELASNIIKTSYLGFFSALHFHSLTEQVPQKTQIASTKRKNSLNIQGRKAEFVKIRPEDFFGYEDYNGVVSSDPEKTLIDCLRLPQKAGDFSNIAGLEFKNFHTEKLIRYCEKTGSSAVASRLGYLLDQNEVKFNKERLKTITSYYCKLDPGKNNKNASKEWKIYANREI